MEIWTRLLKSSTAVTIGVEIHSKWNVQYLRNITNGAVKWLGVREQCWVAQLMKDLHSWLIECWGWFGLFVCHVPRAFRADKRLILLNVSAAVCLGSDYQADYYSLRQFKCVYQSCSQVSPNHWSLSVTSSRHALLMHRWAHHETAHRLIFTRFHRSWPRSTITLRP